MTWVERFGRTLRVERARGEFCRIVELACPVEFDRLEKQIEQGILSIRLPKLRRPLQDVESHH
jgi:HSP20 family molecular chaperone IbpA